MPDAIHFVDRTRELAFLDQTLQFNRANPAHLILLYGRRRVGKSSLLAHWAARSGLPAAYWVAEKEPAALQRRKLLAAVTQASDPLAAPVAESWASLWNTIAAVFEDSARGRILILDELPYAAEGDTAMLSSLQHAWDQRFKQMRVAIALCGSQVRTMETLMSRQSPLFGRMTDQWHLQPLPFSALRAFFPRWSAEERVAAYAVVGGIPAYLEWLNPDLPLVENIRQVMLRPGSMFLSEPTLLLYDEVREPASFMAILKAIGAGNHTLEAISDACLIAKTNLSMYLVRLQNLRLIERRTPATLQPLQRHKSKRSRYHLTDPFFRFYFRFIAPHQHIYQRTVEPIMAGLQQNLRAFIGQTAFEDLAREWVWRAALRRELPLMPDEVGSHWDRQVQTDVVAVEWAHKRILLGECKWGLDEIDRQVVRELVEHKGPATLKGLPVAGDGWQVSYALFARTGFTRAARDEMRKHGGLLIDLAKLDRDLQEYAT